MELFQTEIKEILVTLLPAGTLTLQQALRRFTAQLLDLSPSFTLFVTRHVIQTTIDDIEKHMEAPEGSEVTEEEEAANDNKKTIRCRN